MPKTLTRERLVAAAVSLVDEEGPESLSMRRLATRVDRQVSSLYNHVSGRGELVEAVRAKLVEGIDVSPFAHQPWDRALESWARSYLSVFAEHPNLIRLLATTPIRDRSTFEMYEVVLAALRAAGWPAGTSVAVMRTVEAHVLGSALDLVAPGNLLDATAAPQGLRALREALRAEHHRESSASAAFDLGTRVLVAGLRQELGDRTPAA